MSEKMTGAEIKEALSVLEDIRPQAFYYDEVNELIEEGLNDYELEDAEREAIERVGKVETIASGIEQDYNGYVVVYFPAHDIYLRFDGEFDSYQATQNFEEWGYEVRAKEITQTVYEEV